MAKSDLLYSVLYTLNQEGILGECVLIGSWCQDFYRDIFNNPFQIPAATTTDADLFVPKKMKYFEPHVDISAMMKQNGFNILIDRGTKSEKFINEDFEFDFLTEAGAKSGEGVFKFKNLNLTAGELRFLEIPLKYNFKYKFRDLEIRLPEPEAFALHKLIVSQRRQTKEKREKDIAAARGLFEYFEDKEEHITRLHKILSDFPRGWQRKVDAALKATAISLPVLQLPD